MLNTFYSTIFKPGEVPLTPSISVSIGLLTLLVLTLNTAGAAHFGIFGVVLLLLIFFGAGLLGCFWLSAAVHFCAQFLGGQGTSSQTFQAVIRGGWPLLLSGPAISLTKLSHPLGSLFTLALMLGALITVTGSVRQVHQTSWTIATVSLALTLGCSALALFGLIVWPLMLIGGL
ncbi:MAG: hypothetical protein ACFCU8_04060 [Thermosynechococcaceae cyanobacterium]